MSKFFYMVKHPLEYIESIKTRNLPVVDFDNPENNCTFCGIDHHFNERKHEEA